MAAAGTLVAGTSIPHLILQLMLLKPHPSLGSVEDARDRATLEENGDKILSPTSHDITANGNEIIDLPAWFGVDEGLGNVLRWVEELDEARAGCSLAKTNPCVRCHRQYYDALDVHTWKRNLVLIQHIPM